MFFHFSRHFGLTNRGRKDFSKISYAATASIVFIQMHTPGLYSIRKKPGYDCLAALITQSHFSPTKRWISYKSKEKLHIPKGAVEPHSLAQTQTQTQTVLLSFSLSLSLSLREQGFQRMRQLCKKKTATISCYSVLFEESR